MTWPEYVRATTEDINSEIARRIGISQPSVSRWFRGSLPDPATAAAFARAYGRPVLEAFVAAGFLTAQEAGERPAAAPPLADLTNKELLVEIERRMEGDTDVGNTDQKTPGPGEPGMPPIELLAAYRQDGPSAYEQQVDDQDEAEAGSQERGSE